MKKTTHLELNKPELTDYVNVEDLNENADIIDEAINENKERLATHLAENASQAHLAKNIGFSNAEMTATNVEEGILEAFMLGNSRKEDLVDKLLLVDDSLPIDYNSTWQDVIGVIGQISTGKKWASGTVSPPSSANLTYKYGYDSTNFSAGCVIVTGLSFKPSYVLIKRHDLGHDQTVYDSRIDAKNAITYTLTRTSYKSGDNHILQLDGISAKIMNDGFQLPAFAQTNLVYDWIAFE